MHLSGGGMEQGQDLGRAAADIFVRLRGGLAVRPPTAARMRHGLERTGLVLAPDRQAKARRLACRPARSAPFYRRIRIGDADQAPCLRLRITTPVSHQVRLFCQPKPAACKVRPIV